MAGVLAAVPFNPARFAPLPSWALIFAELIIVANVVGKVRDRFVDDNATLIKTIFNAFELLMIAGAVVVAGTTPLVGSLEGLITKWAGKIHVVQLGSGAILIILVLVSGYLYVRQGSLPVALIFGTLMIALAGALPAIQSLLTWVIDEPGAFIANWLLSIFNGLFNLKL
jgi:hypothetical protein